MTTCVARIIVLEERRLAPFSIQLPTHDGSNSFVESYGKLGCCALVVFKKKR